VVRPICPIPEPESAFFVFPKTAMEYTFVLLSNITSYAETYFCLSREVASLAIQNRSSTPRTDPIRHPASAQHRSAKSQWWSLTQDTDEGPDWIYQYDHMASAQNPSSETLISQGREKVSRYLNRRRDLLRILFIFLPPEAEIRVYTSVTSWEKTDKLGIRYLKNKIYSNSVSLFTVSRIIALSCEKQFIHQLYLSDRLRGESLAGWESNAQIPSNPSDWQIFPLFTDKYMWS
jgi:hypothetical protein